MHGIWKDFNLSLINFNDLSQLSPRDDLSDEVIVKDVSEDIVKRMTLSDLLSGMATDELVKISSNDTTSNYLLNKLFSGVGSNTTTPLELIEQNDGGNENILFRFDETKIDHVNINNIGSKTHDNIDDHINNVTENHTQYVLLDGSRELLANWDAGNFKIIAKEFEGRGAIPVGFSGFYPKSLTGQPALPDWLAEYNGQTINDAESPFNGITLPNLNGSGGGTKRFLRGSTTSGSTGGTDTHRHQIQNASTAFFAASATTPGAVSIAISQLLGIPFYTGYYNTKPHYYEVVYCLRIK